MKQLQLGVFAKRKAGSKLLIECLSKLGHSVSYYEVNRFETFTAENESKNACSQNHVPNNVQPSSFVTFIFDNRNHNPKTINGELMHCTNGIIIQRTPKQANHISTCGTKPMQKRRSFKPIAKTIAPYIQPKDRKNLPVIRNIEIENNNLGDMLSKNANTVWAIARRYASESGTDQCVPSWTGFFYEVSDVEQDELYESHSVYYLPAIDQSPIRSACFIPTQVFCCMLTF